MLFLLCESFFDLKLTSPLKLYQQSTKKTYYLFTNYLIYWINTDLLDYLRPKETFEWRFESVTQENQGLL